MKFVNSEGEIREVSHETEHDFAHYIHNFGALGIIYEMTMEIIPEFAIKKCIYTGLSFDVLNDKEKRDKLFLNDNYLSLFTQWTNHQFLSAWVAEPIHNFHDIDFNAPYDEVCAKELFGAKLIHNINVIPHMPADNCVTSGYGMWYDKIYHFKADKEPSSAGNELHSEFFIKYEDLQRLIPALEKEAPNFNKMV